MPQLLYSTTKDVAKVNLRRRLGQFTQEALKFKAQMTPYQAFQLKCRISRIK